MIINKNTLTSNGWAVTTSGCSKDGHVGVDGRGAAAEARARRQRFSVAGAATEVRGRGAGFGAEARRGNDI